jgi:hypothetical protein
MRHQFTGSLVALHVILSWAGLSAQDTAAAPRAHIVSGRATPAASQAPSSDNRLLRVTIDSEDYFRGSEIQLDGAAAPLGHFIDWKQIPPGTYELTATLIGPDGTRAQRQTSFRVLGPILAQRCC